MVGMRTYDGGHGQFMGQWEFRIAFKNRQTFAEFFQEPALVDVRWAQRGLPTVSGTSSSLSYFDGPTLASIQYPSKQEELQYCVLPHPRASHWCDSRRGGLDADLVWEDPALWNQALEQRFWTIRVVPSVASLIRNSMMQGWPVQDKFRVLSHWLSEFGTVNEFYGQPSYFVDPSPGGAV